MLHPCLGLLEGGERLDGALGEAAVEDARAYFETFGLNAFRRFIEACEPRLRPLFDLRWPGLGQSAGSETVGAFGESHCEHIVKLLRRRTPSWSATIG